MKRPSAIFVILAFIHLTEGSPLFFDFLSDVSNIFLGSAKQTLANMGHITCRAFADNVIENPMNEPYIEKISFQLLTPCGRKEVPVTEAGKLRDAPDFDADKKTVVFITGWLVGPDKFYIDDMAKAYHCRGDSNFVVVNSGDFLMNEYVNSAYHTGKLGQFIAVGLQNLGIPAEKLHLIGHSLGTHIAGHAGRHFYNVTGKKIQRITGLDPARPCFKTPEVFPRISQDDAVFVDIIHTTPKDIGMEEAVGHADFYPGGLELTQVGCFGISLLCSHEKAIEYFLETVYPGNENSFMSTHCSNYSELEDMLCTGQSSPMGYATDMSLRGIHYLTVKETSPYGKDASISADLLSGECGRCPI